MIVWFRASCRIVFVVRGLGLSPFLVSGLEEGVDGGAVEVDVS